MWGDKERYDMQQKVPGSDVAVVCQLCPLTTSPKLASQHYTDQSVGGLIVRQTTENNSSRVFLLMLLQLSECNLT